MLIVYQSSLVLVYALIFKAEALEKVRSKWKLWDKSLHENRLLTRPRQLDTSTVCIKAYVQGWKYQLEIDNRYCYSLLFCH